MSVHIEGFDGLGEELRELSEDAEAVDGSHEIPMDELFPSSFMETYTEFGSLEEFFTASPWDVETREDFKQIPEKKFDEYVNENTGFSDWEAMLSVAAREWIARQLSRS